MTSIASFVEYKLLMAILENHSERADDILAQMSDLELLVMYQAGQGLMEATQRHREQRLLARKGGDPMTGFDPILTDEEVDECVALATDRALCILKGCEFDHYIPVLITHELTMVEGDSIEPIENLHVMVAMDMDKRWEILRALGESFGEQGKVVRCMIFVSEVWVSHKRGDMPSDDPQRTEAVMVAGMTPKQQSSYALIPITRTAENKMVAGEVSYFKVTGNKVRMSECQEFFAGLHEGLLRHIAHLTMKNL